jgi:eukaryotic-like serine/threonine-protein kinase
LKVTAHEWQQLSPLIDQALDLAAAERARWVDTLVELSPDLREKLRTLVAKHGAPETQNFLNDMPSFGSVPRQRNSDLLADDVVGNYTLIRAIGQGGMGEVWLAKRSDGAYQRSVALKLPNADGNPAKIRERMLRERDVLASLEHPNIARFYDAGVSASGQPFLAMEYVEGDTLIAYAERKKLSTRDRCKLFLQVLAAVQFAHQRLVVHRDLKPTNIMVRESGQVSLLDFGIAKVLDEQSLIGDESQLTRDTGRVLTLAYAAPEQVLSESISTATDVFAAGVLFYELICGVRPFLVYEKSMAAMIDAHNASTKPMPGNFGRDLNAIVAHALRRDPGARYASAAAFAEDIERCLNEQPVTAVQGARWYAASKFVRRQRVALAIGAAGVVTAVGLGVGTFVQWQIAKSESASAATVQKIVESLVSGMSPDNAETRLFTAKELLDRSVKALDGQPLQPALALKFGEVYRMINEPAQSISLMDRALPLAEAQKDYPTVVKLLAYKALAQLEGDQSDNAKVTLKSARTLVASHSTGSSAVTDDVTLAILSLVEGHVAAFANDLSRADAGYADARSRFERVGANTDDLLTFTIAQQSNVALQRGNFSSALTLLGEANAAAKRYGELGTSLALYRLQTEGYLLLDMADPAKAVEVLQRGYAGSVKRFPENHADRLTAGITLAVAQSETGDVGAALRTYDAIREQTNNALFDVRRNALFLESALPGFGETGHGVRVLQSMLTWKGDSGNSRALDAASRTIALRKLGELLITERKPRDALTWLQQAETSEKSQQAQATLGVAQIWVTQAVAHLQLREHELASAKLSAARQVFTEALGASNPRVLSVDVYSALASALASASAHAKTTAPTSAKSADKSAFLLARTAFTRLQSTYSGPKRIERLSAWLSATNNEPEWATLPAFIP